MTAADDRYNGNYGEALFRRWLRLASGERRIDAGNSMTGNRVLNPYSHGVTPEGARLLDAMGLWPRWAGVKE